ncbi:MAG: NADH-quinone oxidoreductase subunit A [Planctomycetes bacterium]|nr:NADH-quinone oxidoreductase subunit A [Planctomycetota bacterium]
MITARAFVPSLDPNLTMALDERGPWLSIVVAGALAITLVGGALLVVRIITRVVDSIRAPAERLSTYECGEEPEGSAWFRFNNRFTTVALTFLVFDVELALLMPILPRCVTWLGEGRGATVFAEIAIFVGTLVLALAWVARKGGFAWDRSVGPVATETTSGGKVDG